MDDELDINGWRVSLKQHF